uniref:C2 domain-containing protein n=1 Tax=Timema shepardi TaxID=629360 RepID=A0A7R9ANF6_TIMSH|nr:unnamed protein product [Timema shepardi]
MASLVLTDSFEKLPHQIMYPYAEAYDLQNMCLAAVTCDGQNLAVELNTTSALANYATEVGMVLPLAVASAMLLLGLLAALLLFRRRKNVDSDNSGPSIVVYPSNQGNGPQFLTKEIRFSLPILRHAESLSDLIPAANDLESDLDTDSLVPVASSAHAQRSNSFSCYGLGVIDPALYRGTLDLEEDLQFPEGHLGRLWFSVRFEPATEKLLVSLLKAKNLPSRTVGTVNSCDPFVSSSGWVWGSTRNIASLFQPSSALQVSPASVVQLANALVVLSSTAEDGEIEVRFSVGLHLIPDERRRYLQSRQKKKTCNPYFDETFVFQVPTKEMEEHILKLSVVDAGRTKRRAVIGHITLPLKSLSNECGPGDQQLFKMDLEKEAQEPVSDLGEILVSLLYNENLHRLSVTVIAARRLKFHEDKKDSYVRVTLNQQYRTVKVKKTAPVKGTDNPDYSECFNFRVPAAHIDVTSVGLHVLQAVSGYGRDKPIGKCVLGSYMFARGKALTHWNTVFSSPMEPVQHWHALCE